MEIALAIFAAYLIGSIPNAYLVTRKFAGRDLRLEGSRNIGARNAWEVTSNKSIGDAVLLLDLLKGAIPVVILVAIDRTDLIPYAGAAAVVGHCYPVWLRFHGGRGLATTAGVGLIVSPISVFAWLLFYSLSSLVRKNVHVQSLIATFGAAVLELILYEDGLTGAFSVLHWQPWQLVALHYAILVIAATIASRFIPPAAEYLKAS